MSVEIDVFPQTASLTIDQGSVSYTTQGRKVFSMSNGGWQWRIQASYRNLTHDKWITLQSNLLQSYGTHALMKFYIDYVYPNAVGFLESTPIKFQVNSTVSQGSSSIVLNNINNISTASRFKTGDILYHPNLGPGNMNIVAADANVGLTTTTIYLVRPIRAEISTGAEISLAEYVWVSAANKDWTVTRNTNGYYNIDVELIARDRFRNYQNG
jgi:hypothetical protein